MILNENLVKKIGLSEKEAVIYELLLNDSESTAGNLIKKSGYKRATTYTVLESLIKKGLVEELELAPVIHYRARHPYVLKEIAETQVRQIQTAESELDALLPELSHIYQESHNQPGVKFYQGKEGIWKVLSETLASKTEVLTIADIDAVDKYAHDINQKYIRLRDKKKIKKRILLIDTPDARQRYVGREADLTGVRLAKMDVVNFNSAIEIFDDKVGYITMTDKYLNSILINDPHIYKMHKTFFEFMWLNAQPVIA